MAAERVVGNPRWPRPLAPANRAEPVDVEGGFARLTAAVRESLIIFDSVIALYAVRWNGHLSRAHALAETYWGRHICFKMRERNRHHMEMQVQAARLACHLQAPHATPTVWASIPGGAKVIVQEAGLPRILMEFAEGPEQIVTEWSPGERSLGHDEMLTDEKLLRQMGEWLCFAELFGILIVGARPFFLLPGDGLLLPALSKAFDSLAGWHRVARHIPEGREAEVAVGVAAMLDKFREREGEVRRILAESELRQMREWQPRIPEASAEYVAARLKGLR